MFFRWSCLWAAFTMPWGGVQGCGEPCPLLYPPKRRAARRMAHSALSYYDEVLGKVFVKVFAP